MLHSPVLEWRHDGRFGTHSAEPPSAPATNNRSLATNDDLPIQTGSSTADGLNGRLAACLRELSLVAMYFDDDFRIRLTKQLRNLLNADEWEEDDSPIDVASFRSLVRGMVLLEPRERPILALNDEGGVIGMWGAGDDRLILDFCAADRVRWYTIRNSDDAGGSDKATGMTSVEKLNAIVDALEVRALIDGAR